MVIASENWTAGMSYVRATRQVKVTVPRWVCASLRVKQHVRRNNERSKMLSYGTYKKTTKNQKKFQRVDKAYEWNMLVTQYRLYELGTCDTPENMPLI